MTHSFPTRRSSDLADAYSLLTAIGRDCVGALQFLTADDDDHYHHPAVDTGGDDDDDGGGDDADSGDRARHGDITVDGEALNEAAIEKLLQGHAQATLDITREDEFRISVTGGQEKTALLWFNGRWFTPHGTTPTTHIFMTPFDQLPHCID